MLAVADPAGNPNGFKGFRPGQIQIIGIDKRGGAERQSRRQFNRFSKLPLQPWDAAEDEAWTALQTPIRDESSGIMRAKSLRFDFRSELPEWFATNGFSPVAPDHKEATGQR